MNWIKQAVINSGAPKLGIIDVLRKNVGGFEPKRSISTVHASDITKPDFCPRQWALLDLHEKERKPQFISAAMRATFDVGNMTAKLLIENWAGESAIGNWECKRCDAQATMCSKPKCGCKQHGKKCSWEYREPVFVSEEYGVSGSIDLLIDLQSQKWVVTELKIIKPEEFTDIVAPLPEHRIRTGLYLKLIADSGSIWKDKINLHEARVLYCSRGYGKKHSSGEILPWREFVVPRDDATLAQPLARAKQIKVFRENGLMPSGICFTALDKAAKSCEVCKECFSGQHPVQQGKLP